MARRRISSWGRAGRLRRTRDAYRAQGCLLNGVTLLAMVLAFAGCGLAIAATGSAVLGAIVGVVLYFWIFSRGYDELTGSDE